MAKINRFKSERNRIGYTQEQVANKLNTSRSNIANWENGQNMPSLELLFKCSDLYDCDVMYLAGYQKERKSNGDYFPIELYEQDALNDSSNNLQRLEELLKYENIIPKNFKISDKDYSKIMNFLKNNQSLLFDDSKSS